MYTYTLRYTHTHTHTFINPLDPVSVKMISYNYPFILSHLGHAHQTHDSNDTQIKKKNRIPEVQGERTVLLINGAESAGYLYGKEKAV